MPQKSRSILSRLTVFPSVSQGVHRANFKLSSHETFEEILRLIRFDTWVAKNLHHHIAQRNVFKAN